jgi:hypothetical protein
MIKEQNYRASGNSFDIACAVERSEAVKAVLPTD